MKKNMSGIDRGIRVIVALAIGVLFYNGTLAIGSTIGIIAAIVGAIFLLTSLVSSCPLYSVLGLSTCKTTEK